jgi:hypothetical protein
MSVDKVKSMNNWQNWGGKILWDTDLEEAVICLEPGEKQSTVVRAWIAEDGDKVTIAPKHYAKPYKANNSALTIDFVTEIKYYKSKCKRLTSILQGLSRKKDETITE